MTTSDSNPHAESDARDTAEEATLAQQRVGGPAELTPAQRSMAADAPSGVGVLVIERGATAGSRFLLDADSTTIGRHPDSDVLLDDITVSRRHASIARTSECYRIADAGSLNGTYVNNVRVEDISLQPGDQVLIGRFHFVYLVGTGPA